MKIFRRLILLFGQSKYSPHPDPLLVYYVDNAGNRFLDNNNNIFAKEV